MADFRELYQEMILEHAKRPRNSGTLPDARRADGYNPLCGDRLSVYADVEDGMVKRLAFEGQGCAISKASASLMTEAVSGRSVEEAEALFRDFHAVLTGEDEPDTDELGRLGKLAVLAGVRDYPTRIKCASLAWHALHNALAGKDEPARTE